MRIMVWLMLSDWFSTWQTGLSRCWRVCRQIIRGPIHGDRLTAWKSLLMTITGFRPFWNIHFAKILSIKFEWNLEWSGMASGRKFMLGAGVFFFSSVLCFLRGTSLKRARDDFPLHALVIIWEGEFIRGRKSPGAKKKEPHHGQGRLGALWKISTPRRHSNLWGN